MNEVDGSGYARGNVSLPAASGFSLDKAVADFRIYAGDPGELVKVGVAERVQPLRLCDPHELGDTPQSAAAKRLNARVAEETRQMLDEAARAGDPRGVLVLLRSEGDWLYADVALSDQVKAGEVEAR